MTGNCGKENQPQIFAWSSPSKHNYPFVLTVKKGAPQVLEGGGGAEVGQDIIATSKQFHPDLSAVSQESQSPWACLRV